MDILIYVIFGFVAGTVAKLLHPGKDPGGWIITILLGVVGSLLGRWLAGLFGLYVEDSIWSPLNWIVSIGAAILLLFIYSQFKRK